MRPSVMPQADAGGGIARTARCLALVAIVLVASLSSGCATIFKGSSQQVKIQCATPGAKLKIDGVPASFGEQTLKRSKTYFVNVEAPGHEAAGVKIDSSLAPGWIILDLFLTGAMGILVDAITGAWNNLEPWDINLTLSPSAGPPPAQPPPPQKAPGRGGDGG